MCEESLESVQGETKKEHKQSYEIYLPHTYYFQLQKLYDYNFQHINISTTMQHKNNLTTCHIETQ